MGETFGKTDCGISLGEATITDLDFADDVVIFTLDKLSTESELLGLQIFLIKTKIQKFVALFDKNRFLPPPVRPTA